MSNVSQATFCKYCSTEISTPLKGYHDRCPSCFKIIVKPDNKHFETPNYIYLQEQQLMAKTKEDKIDPDSDDYLDVMAEVIESRNKWLRDCLHEDRHSALMDALLYMRHLPYTRSTGDEMKQLLNIADYIGELAKSIRQLHKSGVTLYDGEVRQIRPQPRDDEANQAAATASRDS